jgi:hypothetical protein
VGDVGALRVWRPTAQPSAEGAARAATVGFFWNDPDQAGPAKPEESMDIVKGPFARGVAAGALLALVGLRIQALVASKSGKAQASKETPVEAGAAGAGAGAGAGSGGDASTGEGVPCVLWAGCARAPASSDRPPPMTVRLTCKEIRIGTRRSCGMLCGLGWRPLGVGRSPHRPVCAPRLKHPSDPSPHPSPTPPFPHQRLLVALAPSRRPTRGLWLRPVAAQP